MELKSDLKAQRLAKAAQLAEGGVALYPNDFSPTHTTGELRRRYGEWTTHQIENLTETFALGGRLMAIRNFGKAAFAKIADRDGLLQVHFRRDLLGEETYRLFKRLDLGDIIGIEGALFHTKTGELTLAAASLRLLAKSLRPLPEKWHGLTDIEIRYRQRYVDLMVNPEVKQVFITRSKIIQAVRAFLRERDFLEVETPMMQVLPGGATAKPFVTHHNALGIDLFLRVAPELYLKRLVVGGFERVFELNRNFRNEGISIKHNPEFTMLEFYEAYATYEDLMDLTEELICHVAREVGQGLKFEYQGREVDLTPPWPRLGFHQSLSGIGGLDPADLDRPERLMALLDEYDLPREKHDTPGKALTKLFDHLVEPKLFRPTFVYGYPVEVSPLSRRNDERPDLVDRFELYIAGRETANAFSELNDPVDQRQRFEAQMAERAAGDEEAQPLDEDYIRALEYGLPPTAGCGIGLDRLVMLLTDQASIRDVILFPHLRPEQ